MSPYLSRNGGLPGNHHYRGERPVRCLKELVREEHASCMGRCKGLGGFQRIWRSRIFGPLDSRLRLTGP